MTDGGVRCQNQKCRAKLAEALNGELTVTCRKCGKEQTIIIRLRDTPPVSTHRQNAA